MLPSDNRLRSNYEFRKVKYLSEKHKTSSSGDLFFINYIKPYNYEGPSKFGIVVSNRIHKSSAKRNRIKRLFREIIRNNLDKIENGYWIVLYPKYKVLGKSYEELNSDFTKVLQNLPFSR